jgi:uncharacterized protein
VVGARLSGGGAEIGVRVRFDWDPDKSAKNLAERGFGFDLASLIFEGSIVEWPDDRTDYGEARVVALGQVEDKILVVVYTDRSDLRRIISARPANRKERRRWQLSAKL